MKLVAQRLIITAAFGVFLLTLFTPQTILMGCITIYLALRYAKSIVSQYLNRGVISFLPEGIKQQLLTRSLFDLLCDFWFMEWASIAKVCVKPFIEHIEPDQAADVLNELPPELKHKFLTKGILRILPQNCQELVAPGIQFQKETSLQLSSDNELQEKPMLQSPPRTLPPSTDDTLLRRKDRPRKGSSLLLHKKFIDQISNNENSSQTSKKMNFKRVEIRYGQPQWDKLELYRGLKKKLRKDGVAGTLKTAVEMGKKLIEINKVSNRVRNINSVTVFKFTILFWILIIIQVKMSPHARRLIFKTLYIMSGIMSILGAVVTSGMLIYKFKKSNRKNDSQNDSIEL